MKFKEAFHLPEKAEMEEEDIYSPLSLGIYYLTGIEEHSQFLKLIMKTSEGDESVALIRPVKKEYIVYFPRLKKILEKYIGGEENVKEVMSEVGEMVVSYFR